MKDIINIDLYRVRFADFIKVSLMLIALVSFNAVAQDQQVSGTIVDETGAGLPGASILIKGTSTGTVTDMDGKYSISAGSDDVLVVSFIGYATQEISVGGRSTIDVSMALDAEQLTEVVVTGYSVDSRRETTGSVTTVDSRSLAAVPSGNIEQQLQGRVAGVTVITNGQPGTQSQVRVRGFGSTTGNQPMYVVDGISVYGSVNFLHPDDIESTTVLKDATAAAIYGARAAAGVIVIETKKGKRNSGKLSVTYKGMYGVTDPGTGLNIVSPQEHADLTWLAARNGASNATFINQNDDDATNDDPVNFLDLINSGAKAQFGEGEEPVLPDYLLVGTTGAENAGISGDINLAHHAARYNVDPNAGPVYQVVRAAQGSGTDWYDELTRVARIQRHHIGIKGGGESSAFFVSLGMQEQQGVVSHQTFWRYNLRANTEFDLNPNIRLGQNFQAAYINAINLQGGNGGQASANDENVILAAFRMPSIIPVYDEFGGFAGTSVGGFNNPANPVATMYGQRNNRNINGFVLGNVYLEVEPIENLKIRSNYGGSFGISNGKAFTRRTYENSENNGAFGFSENFGWGSNWQWTNTINYKRDFDIHSVDVLVGQEALNIGTGRGINGSGINPFSQNINFVSLGTVEANPVSGGFGNGITFSSFFGRLKYDYDDKYLATIVVRRDGSSRFAEDERYGVFPAISGAWRISSEGFMSGLSFLDDMKIRGGWGVVGNSNGVNPNNQFSLFGTNLNQSSYDISGTNSAAAAGFYRNQIGNSSARWEEVVTTNIGIDALFLEGKVDVQLDFWKKTTEDMLFQSPVSDQRGPAANAPAVNVGEMENRGIDFRIVNKGDISAVDGLKYEVTLNGGFLENEIKKFDDNVEFVGPQGGRTDLRGIQPIRNQVGYSLSAFYGYEVDGLWQSEAEVLNAHAQAPSGTFQPDAAPGRFRFKDINGDGEITTDDRKILGDPIPDFTGGVTLKFIYKAFELEAYGFVSLGNEIYNASRRFTDFYALFPGAGISDRARDAWTPTNTNTDVPIFESASNFSNLGESNSYYVEDGSYFRMQNISLSYKLPQSVLNSVKLTEVKVTGAVNNVFTITNYEGLDPSVGGAADTNFGVDTGNFPITRSWTIALNVTF